MNTMIINVINVLASISYGFVLTKLWSWFIIPIFHLPVITIVPAMGIMLTICLFRPVFPAVTIETIEDKEINKKVTLAYAVIYLVYPWVALLSGWIIKFFL